MMKLFGDGLFSSILLISLALLNCSTLFIVLKELRSSTLLIIYNLCQISMAILISLNLCQISTTNLNNSILIG